MNVAGNIYIDTNVFKINTKDLSNGSYIFNGYLQNVFQKVRDLFEMVNGQDFSVVSLQTATNECCIVKTICLTFENR